MKKVLMKGNEVIAEAAIHAGCKAFFGYPITPQNEIPEYMSSHLPKAGGCFVQSESEVAAINMVYGASAAGIRVMTSSSSPGIALKQEGITYMAGARLPCVIVSVMRGGPGLGGILPSQSDYFQATRGGGNGDYYTPVYAPNSVQEASDLVQRAFNMADKYRTPVMVLADGILGQMMEPVAINDIPRVECDKSWTANGNSGIRCRNVVHSMCLDAKGLEQHNINLANVYKEITENETMYESNVKEGDSVAIVAYGIPSRITVNAIELLKEYGINTGLIRPITLWPFPQAPFDELPKSVKHILVVELSMGQMLQDVRLAVNGRLPVHFCGHCGGVIIKPFEIADKVRQILGGR